MLSHKRQANARASKEFGQEITFEDISAETADSVSTTNKDTTASQVEAIGQRTKIQVIIWMKMPEHKQTDLHFLNANLAPEIAALHH